jgi:uncharacterized membrane protein
MSDESVPDPAAATLPGDEPAPDVPVLPVAPPRPDPLPPPSTRTTRAGSDAAAVFPWDLVAIFVLTLLAAVAVLARSDPARVLLGWWLPLGAPGSALLAWLYPARSLPAPEVGGPRSLHAWTRVGLSVVLSVAITIVLGIVVNFGGGITLGTMGFGLGLLTLLFLVLAVDARLRLPVAQRMRVALQRRPADPAAGRTGVGMAALLAISFAGMLLVLVLLFPYKTDVDAYSNLYILGDGGKVTCLPDAYNGTLFGSHPTGRGSCPPATGNITVGVVNHEARVATYFIRVFWSAPTATGIDASASTGNVATMSVQLGPIDVPPIRPDFERQYEQGVHLTPPPLSGVNRLNVQLYKDFGSGVAATPDMYTYFYVNAA